MATTTPTTTIGALALGALAMATFAVPVGASTIADWQLLDDFQSYDTGQVRPPSDVTNGTWTAHGNSGAIRIEDDPDGNKFITMGISGETVNRRTASHAMDSGFQLAPEGGTATYFMRSRFAAGHNESLLGIAIPNVSTGSLGPNFDDYRVQLRINADGSVDVRDGGSFPNAAPAGSIALNEWTNFWMVVHRPGTTGGTWDLYMTTGNDSAVGLSPLLSGINFRVNDAQNLATVLLMGEGAAANFTADFDDIYFSSGENLTLIPEPSSLALLGAGLGLILLRRRRS